MSALTQFTTEQLQAEIDRRNRRIELPKPLDNPNWDSLRAKVIANIEEFYRRVLDGEYEYLGVFPFFPREVYQAVYGPGISDWISGIMEAFRE